MRDNDYLEWEFQQYSGRKKKRRSPFFWAVAAWALFVVVILLCFLVPVKAATAEPMTRTMQEAPDTFAQMREDYENQRIEEALLRRSRRLENVTVSHYCICQRCCGKAPEHPAYGITASGLQATPHVSVAVDPSVIPLGSDVLVDYGDGEIHYYRADDTGAGVKGNHIDLCVSGHEEALQLGLRKATVYWRACE